MGTFLGCFFQLFGGKNPKSRARPISYQDQGKTLTVLIRRSTPKKYRARVLHFLEEEGLWFVRLALFIHGNWRVEAFLMKEVYVVEEGK